MFFLFFLVSALLCCPGSGGSLVNGQPEKVLAFAGGDVVLPCSFNIITSNGFPDVEWSKEGLESNVVFLYRDGCETHEMKNPAFEFRTSFMMKNLQKGDISLRISNLKLSDAGRYQCKRLHRNSPPVITSVELVVGALSEPTLSVVSSDSGGVTVQCEASCWLPQSNITFLDDGGNEIPAEEAKRDQDDSGCYTMRRRGTFHPATNRVTCRAQQLEFNQSREAQIFMSDPTRGMASCHLTPCITAVSFMVLCGLVCGAVWLWNTYGKPAERQKVLVNRQPAEHSTCTINEDHLLLGQRSIADDVDTIDQLTKEVADLRSELREKDATILRLLSRTHQLSPVICQHNRPTIDGSPSRSSVNPSNPGISNSINPQTSANLLQNKCHRLGLQRQNSNPVPACLVHRPRRNYSSPALLSFKAPVPSTSSPGGTSETNPGRIAHSAAEYSAQSDPKLGRQQRRHSTGLAPSFRSNTGYSPMTNLREESELFMS